MQHIVPHLQAQACVSTLRETSAHEWPVIQVDVLGAVQLLVGQVFYPWDKSQPKQVEQGKDDFSVATGIGCVLQNEFF